MMNKKPRLVYALPLLLTGCILGIEPWGPEARFTTYTSEELAAGEKGIDADIRLSVGRLEIEAGDSSKIYDLDLYYNEAAFKPKVEFRRSGDTARLEFELEGGGKMARRISKTHLNLRFNPSLPLSLKAETGVTESRIDLTGMRLRSLDLETGVGETRISALAPNPESCRNAKIRSGVGAVEFTGLGNLNAEKVVFEGGVGAASLDFSGSWVDRAEVEVRVGVGGVEMLLPRDLGVELRMTKSFLSGLSISGFRQEGSTYLSDNMDRASKVIRIRVQAGIGGVDVSWM